LGHVSGRNVAPGDVDEEVLNSPAVQSLQAAHQNELSVPEGLLDKLSGTNRPQYVDTFKQQLTGLLPGQVPVANSMFPASPFDPIKNQQQGPGQTVLADLPDPKGALTLESAKDGSPAQTGMSVVSRPDPKVPALPPGAPGAGQQKNLPNPINPNAQPIIYADEEVTWITVSGMIDMKKLAATFQKANIPDLQAFTCLLRTELVRQEMLPNGTWGKDEVISDLTNAFLPPWPPVNANAQVDYLTWATANTPQIVQPPFYEILRGQLWKTVAMLDPADVANAQPQATTFDAATVKPGEVYKLPPDQRALWWKWHQEQEAQKAQQHKSPAPARSAPGGGSGVGAASGGHADAGPSRFGASIILVGDHSFSGDPDAGRGRPTFVPQPNRGAASGPQPAFTNGVQQMAIPNGQFLPAQQVQDLEVWAHDETTIPGVMYRYKLRVHLKNPLFGTVNVAKNQAIASIFSVSMETDWSKPIQSPKKHEFFVMNGGTTFNGVAKVGVDYVDWQDGAWKLTSMTLQPGDRVGQTPWTIVDLRPAGNTEGDSRVLLINDNGQLTSRFYKTDRIDPEYLNLKKLLPPPPVPTGPGGVPSASGV
jgi:hypothetical protein